MQPQPAAETETVLPKELLVIANDASIRSALQEVLALGGYHTTLLDSPDAAHALIDERTFALILTDVFPHSATDQFDAVEALRHQAFPTPMLLVSAWQLDQEAVSARGFAGIVSMPFDLDEFLATVAACLNHPLDATQTRQAEVVARYFAALSAKEWDALAALCAADVTYVLPGESAFAHTVSGREAFRDFSATTFAQFPDARFTDVTVYPLPVGLAARYRGRWHTATGEEVIQSGAVIFRFAGLEIAQIGVRLNTGRLERIVR